MSVKNYGPLVSGYLDPDGRNWETTVFQAGKPVLDKELNLQEDIATDTNRLVRVRTNPSGWLAAVVGGFPRTSLDSSDVSGDLFATSVAPNFLVIQPLLAQVNGWHLNINNTIAAGFNVLDLGVSPAGIAAHREDLVILEVWRRLIPPSPSGVGKSSAGRIWNNGNVKIGVADDLTLNFVDDILDGTVGSETTKRVQIQYRLRVIQGVDLFGSPYGINDPTVFANSVPAAPLSPDGVATTFNYTNASANGDPGLWVAGDGIPTNTLGTVDGFMYAMPLLAVVRRNTSAFDRNANHNGGVADPGPSDRPDGLFYDVFDVRDIIDLRSSTSPDGWNYQEVLEKNFNFLMDNEIRTEIGSTLIGGGVNGHTVLNADDIGISNANGGDGVVTGDTPGANLIGQFDEVLRRFSDRPQTEVMVLTYSPAGPNWVNNEVVIVSFSALPIFTHGAPFNWAAYAPANITCVELIGNAGIFLGSGGASPSTISFMQSVSGLGQIPQGSLSVNIGTVPAGITNEPLILLFLISYPPGLGLTKTPTNTFPDTLFFNNPLQLPAAPPVLFNTVDGFAVDFPHREVTLTYQTVSQTLTVSPVTSSLVFLPERVELISAITINAVPYFGPAVPDTTGFIIDFTPTVLAPTDTIAITFQSLRPFPQNDEQVTIYYEARMPQTTRDALLGAATLNALPRFISTDLHTLTVGSGSEDEAYPFPFQYVQPGGVFPTSGGVFAGDHELDGRALIYISDFNASTGWLRLPTFVGYVPAPDQAKFDRTPGDVDAEGRSYFPTSTFGVYVANAFAQELSDPKRHKVLLPVLAELQADTSWGFAGQMFLLILSRWALFDTDNSVEFDANPVTNTTTASVYRIKGNLLNRRPS